MKLLVVFCLAWVATAQRSYIGLEVEFPRLVAFVANVQRGWGSNRPLVQQQRKLRYRQKLAITEVTTGPDAAANIPIFAATIDSVGGDDGHPEDDMGIIEAVTGPIPLMEGARERQHTLHIHAVKAYDKFTDAIEQACQNPQLRKKMDAALKDRLDHRIRGLDLAMLLRRQQERRREREARRIRREHEERQRQRQQEYDDLEEEPRFFGMSFGGGNNNQEEPAPESHAVALSEVLTIYHNQLSRQQLPFRLTEQRPFSDLSGDWYIGCPVKRPNPFQSSGVQVNYAVQLHGLSSPVMPLLFSEEKLNWEAMREMFTNYVTRVFPSLDEHSKAEIIGAFLAGGWASVARARARAQPGLEAGMVKNLHDQMIKAHVGELGAMISSPFAYAALVSRIQDEKFHAFTEAQLIYSLRPETMNLEKQVVVDGLIVLFGDWKGIHRVQAKVNPTEPMNRAYHRINPFVVEGLTRAKDRWSIVYESRLSQGRLNQAFAPRMNDKRRTDAAIWQRLSPVIQLVLNMNAEVGEMHSLHHTLVTSRPGNSPPLYSVEQARVYTHCTTGGDGEELVYKPATLSCCKALRAFHERGVPKRVEERLLPARVAGVSSSSAVEIHNNLGCPALRSVVQYAQKHRKACRLQVFLKMLKASCDGGFCRDSDVAFVDGTEEEVKLTLTGGRILFQGSDLQLMCGLEYQHEDNKLEFKIGHRIHKFTFRNPFSEMMKKFAVNCDMMELSSLLDPSTLQLSAEQASRFPRDVFQSRRPDDPLELFKNKKLSARQVALYKDDEMRENLVDDPLFQQYPDFWKEVIQCSRQARARNPAMWEV